jgi:hypothetical protein
MSISGSVLALPICCAWQKRRILRNGMVQYSRRSDAFQGMPRPPVSVSNAPKAQSNNGMPDARPANLSILAVRASLMRGVGRPSEIRVEEDMKHKFVGFALLVMWVISQVLAQEGWDKYKHRTLKEITTVLAEASFKDPDVLITNHKGGSIILSRDTFPSQVKVLYRESSRKVSDKKKEVIAAWLRVYGTPQEHLNLVEAEYLFMEDSIEYWLPVQKQVASHFEKELQKGDRVNLYVAWVGARKESGSVDQVFLVNEFEKE